MLIVYSAIVSILSISAGLFFHLKARKRKAYIESQSEALRENSVDEIISGIEREDSQTLSKLSVGNEALSKLQLVLKEQEAKLSSINVGLAPPTFSSSDSEKLKEAILNHRHAQYLCIAEGDATDAYSDWQWLGSRRDGKAMVDNYQALLLRAFNAEFDVIRKQMRVSSYDTAISKLYRLVGQLSKLGETANVGITSKYLGLKIEELTSWHSALEKIESEKAQRKANRELLKSQRYLADDDDDLEEELAARDSDLAKAKRKAQELIGKERASIELQIQKIEEEKARLEEKFARAISQAQVTRAGYIYVISNHGSFGSDVLKIGMTRRLEPMDRVVELGDASVPFKFDVHVLAFVENAPTIERELHNRFADQRVNIENHRKEFFRVSLSQVKQAMEDLRIDADWFFDAEAKEYSESALIRKAMTSMSEKVTPISSLPESI